MIIFKKIRWKNFLSTGNAFIEIDLNKSKTTLIEGKNGAGKSTLLDALTFSLFGKPYRNINKPQLVNSKNQKDMVVEIEFSVDNSEYKIIRGIKPAIFEVYKDDVLIDQDAGVGDYQSNFEKNILKMNIKSFSQIVVLGSASFVPFMQLPTPQRREIIEDLLDIQIFTNMNILLKKRMDENKDQINETKYQLELLRNKIKSAKEYNKSIEQIKTSEIDNINKKINDLKLEEEKLQNNIEEINLKIKNIQEKSEQLHFNEKKLPELKNTKTNLINRIKNISKEIKFYEDNNTCPTCKQNINLKFKNDILDKRNKYLVEYNELFNKLENEIVKSQKKEEQQNKINEFIFKLNNALLEKNAKIKMLADTKKSYENDLNNIYSKNKDMVMMDVDILLNEFEILENNQNKNYKDHELYNLTYSLLKDNGIKAAIIKQYIPVINALINKYLEEMDFFVQFELDENFKETIKSRFRDIFSYNSFSQGQKARIDICLLLTWRELSQLRNSMSTNLLILDEVFDGSLEIEGAEYLMDIINTLGDNMRVFFISHSKDQLYDKFDRTIKFELIKDFSRIANDR